MEGRNVDFAKMEPYSALNWLVTKDNLKEVLEGK